MFQQRRALPIMRIITLQSVDERNDHRAVEEWIFAVTFFRSAPTRVAAQIRVRRKNDESALVIFFTLRDVTRLVAFCRGGLLQNVWIPRFAQTDFLRKNGGWYWRF